MQKNESLQLKNIILELESERDSCQTELEQAKAASLSAKEGFQRANRLLFEENIQLKEKLTQVGQ